MKNSQMEDSGRHLPSSCRIESVLCILELFVCVQTLNIEERMFCSLCRDTNIDINSFAKLGKDLALAIYKQPNSSAVQEKSRAWNKKCKTLRRIERAFYLLASSMKIPLCFKNQQTCTYWRDIVQYLATNGSEIAKGFFIEQKAIQNSRCKQYLPESKKEGRKRFINQNAIWEELVRKKRTIAHSRDCFIKCKETKHRTLMPSAFKNFCNEDSYRVYEMCLAKYYSRLENQTEKKALSNRQSMFYTDYTTGAYFYNFKLNK